MYLQKLTTAAAVHATKTVVGVQSLTGDARTGYLAVMQTEKQLGVAVLHWSPSGHSLELDLK